jgi:L-serine deaminase
MASSEVKKMGKHNPEVQHTYGNAWEVMKPFVHFGIKATGFLASTLITIIKHIPKPDNQKATERKKDKITKT